MKTEIKKILPSNRINLWNSYLSKKEKGLKKESSKILAQFIENLKNSDDKTVKDFVYLLTDKHREEELKIDFRLFEKVIFPVLISEIKSNKKTANRRLAQFDQFLSPSNPLFKNLKEQLNYKNNYFKPADFYQKEIELNKTDLIAVAGFLSRVAIDLNYATHELPDFGLLCEVNYFENELKRFKNYFELYPKKEIWLSKIKYWEFILKTWTAYTKNPENSENYKDYLKSKNLEFIT